MISSAETLYQGNLTPKVTVEHFPDIQRLDLDGSPVWLLEQIGTGGTSRIYRGLDEGFDGGKRFCAVKVVNMERGPREDLDKWAWHSTYHPTITGWHTNRAHTIEPELNDCLTRGRLGRHPNILPVHRFGIVAEGRFIQTSPFCEYGDLGSLIKRSGPLPSEKAVALALPVLSAIQYAHTLRFVINDIKPGNVLLADQDTPLLTDFTLARPADSSGRCQWSPAGSRAYQAPEACYMELSFRTDIYSAGIMMYEMLTGTVPFSGESLELSLQHMTRPVPSFTELTGMQDAARDRYWPVVAKALHKEPGLRFSSAAEFAFALQTVRNRSGISRQK